MTTTHSYKYDTVNCQLHAVKTEGNAVLISEPITNPEDINDNHFFSLEYKDSPLARTIQIPKRWKEMSAKNAKFHLAVRYAENPICIMDFLKIAKCWGTVFEKGIKIFITPVLRDPPALIGYLSNKYPGILIKDHMGVSLDSNGYPTKKF